MKKQGIRYQVSRVFRNVPLRTLLILPFVFLLVVTVGVIGHLSFRAGEKAVNDVADQLLGELNARIIQKLSGYLEIPHQLNRMNANLFTANLVTFNDTKRLERHLVNQLLQYEVSGIGFATEQDDYSEALRLPDMAIAAGSSGRDTNWELIDWYRDRDANRGEHYKTISDYHPTQRPWYQASAKLGKPAWSDIYTMKTVLELIVTASYPVFDSQGNLTAVTATGIRLSQLNDFLKGLQIGKKGIACILERSGMFIATSMKDQKVVRPEPDGSSTRVNAIQSKNPLVSMSIQRLVRDFGDLREITTLQSLRINIGDELYFLNVTPYRDALGIDWIILMVVPESDFLGEINANVRTIFLFCLAAVLLSVLISVSTAQWVINPILALNDAAKKITNGQWDADIVKGERYDEIGELTESFGRMGRQLKESFETLDQRVRERTFELAKAKEKADAANEAKSAFLANMSHELRTPLNSILGFAQIITRNPDIPPKAREYLGIIQRNGKHLLTLINQVLDLSKIEAGRMTLNENNFDLHRLLDDVKDLFYLKARQNGLKFLVERADSVPRYVRTDEVRLRQVLINLLNNAMKFTQEGGVTVRITVLNDQQSGIRTLHFEIEDTGPGIAPEDMDILFEAFAQTNTGNQAQEGTGLGLPISRKFVQLMGGDMAVNSVVGHGSAFSFDIHVTEIDDKDIGARPKTRRAVALEPGQPGYRLLIVDDNPNNRTFLAKLLSPFGFDLREAVNGQDALDIWKSWNPHLIWMDMRMPVMDGYEATRRIKTAPQEPHPVIIAVTASSFTREHAGILAAGCDDVLQKPFLIEEVFVMLSKHLGVRFIYENTLSKETKQNKQTLTPAMLSTLPSAWLAEFQKTVNELNTAKTLALIEGLDPAYDRIAAALSDLVAAYRFDTLQSLMEEREP